MITKLVPDASYTKVSYDGGTLASAERVEIPGGETRVISTGLICEKNLILAFDELGNKGLGMCVLITTTAPRFREIKVAVLNRGTDPVVIESGSTFLEFFEI